MRFGALTMEELPLIITEISDRSSDGRTRPFKCRCADDDLYYVKGHAALHRGLICEWMAGHLAAALGLNLPRCAIAYAPPELVKWHPEGRDLGAGWVFASRAVERLNWISFGSVATLPKALRRDILVFDWWVRNADRTLSEKDGNPNLLFDTDSGELVVIDHNLAFDPEFDEKLFFETHIFGGEWAGLCEDLVEMANYQSRLKETLDRVWVDAWKQVPAEWLFYDEEQTIPTDFDDAAWLKMLERCTLETFWRLA